MNEKLTFFWSWMKNLPVWLRAIVLLLLSVLALIASMSLSACGTMTSATIRNIQPNTSTAITISNNTQQDTDINTTADVSANLN